MATATIDKVQNDALAMSVASALALANEAALKEGIDVRKSLVTITEEQVPTGLIWKINYGPRDYMRKRGGDLIVIVEDATQSIQRIMRGQ